jgi:hypothetical protein
MYVVVRVIAIRRSTYGLLEHQSQAADQHSMHQTVPEAANSLHLVPHSKEQASDWAWPVCERA